MMKGGRARGRRLTGKVTFVGSHETRLGMIRVIRGVHSRTLSGKMVVGSTCYSHSVAESCSERTLGTFFTALGRRSFRIMMIEDLGSVASSVCSLRRFMGAVASVNV